MWLFPAIALVLLSRSRLFYVPCDQQWWCFFIQYYIQRSLFYAKSWSSHGESISLKDVAEVKAQGGLRKFRQCYGKVVAHFCTYYKSLVDLVAIDSFSLASAGWFWQDSMRERERERDRERERVPPSCLPSAVECQEGLIRYSNTMEAWCIFF